MPSIASHQVIRGDVLSASKDEIVGMVSAQYIRMA